MVGVRVLGFDQTDCLIIGALNLVTEEVCYIKWGYFTEKNILNKNPGYGAPLKSVGAAAPPFSSPVRGI